MTHARPLTPLEVDTLRVALALLLETDAESDALHHARATASVSAIASDFQIDGLLNELERAEVDVRRASR